MATNETKGVVDALRKDFGLNNLCVTSSAVFSTSSFSNLTMTIIALALRISEEVERRLITKADQPARRVGRVPASAHV